MPWVEADRFLAHTPAGTYLWPYVVFILPNLFFSGAIFFTTATLTRNILSTYIGSVVLLVGYLIASAYLSDLKNEHLAATLDAFGLGAIDLTTRYWTAADKNTRLLPLSSFVLLNRALWLAVGLGLLAFCYARFRFSAFASDKAPRKNKKVAAALADDALAAPAAGALRLPRVAQLFTPAMHLRQWGSLTKLEFRGIVRNVYFAAIVGAVVIFLLANASQIGKTFDATTYPVTGQVITVLSGTFFLFLLIIIIYYSGELVWREREAGVAQITDAVPVPTWVPFMSKLAALGLVQVVLLTVLLCGLLVQTVKGYFHYEIGLYLKALFGLELPCLLLLCVLAMLVQVLVNNKYLGFFVMILYYVANIFRGQLGFTHRLFAYGGASSAPLRHERLRPLYAGLLVDEAVLGRLGHPAGAAGQSALGARHRHHGPPHRGAPPLGRRQHAGGAGGGSSYHRGRQLYFLQHQHPQPVPDAQAARKAAGAVRKAVPPPARRGPAAHRGREPEHRHLPRHAAGAFPGAVYAGE